MKIYLNGVDDRGVQRPAIRQSVMGFKQSTLVGLYTMVGQHGIGDVIGGGDITDYSGLANHANYQAGGAALQTAAGQYFSAPGGGIITPIPIDDSYTVIVAVQQDWSENPASDKFPVYHMTSAGLSGSVSSANSPNNGGLALTQHLDDSIAGSLDLGVYAAATVFSGGNRRSGTRFPAASRSRFVMALSVNSATNVIRFISSAGNFVETNSAAMDLVRACTGTHAFGLFSVDGAPLAGELSLAVVHNAALGDEDLSREYDNARRMIRRRGNIEVY